MAEERNYLDMLTGLLSVLSPGEAEAEVVARDPKAQELIGAVEHSSTMPKNSREINPLMSGRFDPLLKQVYQQVLSAAQNRPETTGVSVARRLPADAEEKGFVGAYYPDTKDIYIKEHNPLYSNSNRYTSMVPTAMPYQDALVHELSHFLLNQLRPELVKNMPPTFSNMLQTWSPKERAGLLDGLLTSTDAQHDFISYLLGDWGNPVSITPTGRTEVLDLASLPPRTPFMSTKVPSSMMARNIWTAALSRLFNDPQLLQRAITPLQHGVGGR